MTNQRTSSSRPSLSVAVVPRTTMTMTMTIAMALIVILQSCHDNDNDNNNNIPLFAMGLSTTTTTTTTMPIIHGIGIPQRTPFTVNYIQQQQQQQQPRYNSRRTTMMMMPPPPSSKSSSLFSSSRNEQDEDDDNRQSAELVDDDDDSSNSLESNSLESTPSTASTASTAAASSTSTPTPTSSNSFLSNIRNVFKNKNKLNRESLSKLGLSALLAYGFVSNVSGVIAVSCAWFVFSKRTGLSPLANKPAFLAIYAGFAVVLNVIRPARFALSVVLSPYFERLRGALRRRFGVSARTAAALVVLFVNLIGTCTLMACGVGLASALAGVPVWAR